MERSKNLLYNETGCHNCWYIITVLDPNPTYVCPCCGRKGEELMALRNKYRKSLTPTL